MSTKFLDFGLQFASILAPFWLPKLLFSESKMSLIFWLTFKAILAPFWEPFFNIFASNEWSSYSVWTIIGSWNSMAHAKLNTRRHSVQYAVVAKSGWCLDISAFVVELLVFSRHARISWNIEAGEGLRAPNEWNFFAGAISMLCGAHVYYSYMTRKAVLPKSNTVTGVIDRIRARNRFGTFGVFNLEILEICKFVWSNRIFSGSFLGCGFGLAWPNRKTNLKRRS